MKKKTAKKKSQMTNQYVSQPNPYLLWRTDRSNHEIIISIASGNLIGEGQLSKAKVKAEAYKLAARKLRELADTAEKLSNE